MKVKNSQANHFTYEPALVDQQLHELCMVYQLFDRLYNVPYVQCPLLKIREAMKQVQDAVIAAKPLLKSTMINLTTIHLTMMVLSLNTEEDLAR